MTLRFKRTSSPGHEPKVDASKLKEVVEIRNGNVNHLELTRDFEYKGVIMFSLKVAKQTLSPGSQKTNQVLEENVLVWGEDTSSIIMNQMIGLRLVDRFNVRFPVAFKGTDLKSGHLWEDVLYCDAFKLMCAPHPISRISLHKDDIAKARLAYAQDLLLKFQTEIDDSIKVRIARLLIYAKFDHLLRDLSIQKPSYSARFQCKQQPRAKKTTTKDLPS